MTPGCSGSNPTHCKSKVTAKAGIGQGFKRPERQLRRTEPLAGPSPFSDANARTLHTKRFCPRKSSMNLALRSPSPAQVSCLGDPPVPSLRRLTTCPCISVNSTGIRGQLGKTFLLQMPLFPSPVPPTSHAAAVKRFEMTTSSGFWLSNKCQKHATNVKQILPQLGKSSCHAATANETRLARTQSGTVSG